ncbi:hypothetical protein ID852_00815 [Xenorhabdus sp. 42]|uniref:hypothetical protein n=1 Tax=Xenorhabdus szentirmaii TaxID=290112 RepID=UPI00199E15D2|nr:hypothetical protein [Xenorhabdus sp. 42]MBD2819259.1 hypothetical protein [Xenorhabdus sp. 42]
MAETVPELWIGFQPAQCFTGALNHFLHQASFITGYGCYDCHRSVRLVMLVSLAINQIAKIGLSSLQVIYYLAQLFRH